MESQEKAQMIVCSGTHGTGKSTGALRLALHIKMTEPQVLLGVVFEAVGECPYPVNQDASVDAQRWLYHHQATKELDARRFNDVVVSDRSLLDYAAYSHALGYERLANIMLEEFKLILPLYEEIHFFTIRGNNHLHADGRRDTDPEWRAMVETILYEMYVETGITKTERFVKH